MNKLYNPHTILLLSLLSTLYPASQEQQPDIQNNKKIEFKENRMDPKYIQEYNTIEELYEKQGVTKLLKIAAATMEQIDWIEQPEYDLLQKKCSLQNEIRAAELYNNQIITSLQSYQEELAKLSPLEKVFKEKKIKKEIASLLQRQEELHQQCSRIAMAMGMINYALNVKKDCIFKIQKPGSAQIFYIDIVPIRQEARDLKKKYHFSEIINYNGKEHTLSPKEQEALLKSKQALLEKILPLYHKASFYATCARNLYLAEAFELDIIYDELAYMAQSLM